MIKKIFLGLSVGGLILFGAGCGSRQPADQLDQQPSASDQTQQTQILQPDTTTSSAMTTSTSETSSSTTMQTPSLAFPGILPAAQVNKKVLIKTSLGNIVVQVMADQGPRAASNFVYLVEHRFYDGTIFHRVIPGFMIQGGDPTGTGTGGPGYQFANDPVKIGYTDGIVAMANAGRDTNGSQFFVMVADTPLPPDYSIFGKVVSGLDVAHKIAAVPRDGNDRPNTDVKMLSVTIE